ncbi:hypothetical protein GQ43DRAFT_366182 [Delitschia confertaspora ATCC 74209]|uniref:Uncharacterized protein n=1 Tax=Delitschia confertaspora ATCC 74209 TaxID=1513339 RepID=A0A9P4MXZ9_9PLEO|nr:hypothetical protein GQ43DRAFT_366182 [Delitschia confertaspora ATCC 74209]
MPKPTTNKKNAPLDTTISLAEILADLTSLRFCQDQNAALALVSARANQPPVPKADESELDPDLKRAKDLVELHYSVKVAHQRGELERGLDEARQAVRGAVG